MTVSQMIEWLKSKPQDAVVSCVYHTSGSNYYEQGGTVEVVEFTGTEPTTENNYFSDFEFYEWKSGDKTLTIGSTGN